MAKSKFADVFAPFIEETMNSFAYVTREFGFEHVETSVVSYECAITFRKDARVALTVSCEAGSLPWVMLIGRLGDRTEEAALDFVIQRRCPERQTEPEHHFPEPFENVKTLLRQYASALRECASDFLQGDPSVLREVKPLVDADYKRRQREMRREEKQAAAKRKKK